MTLSEIISNEERRRREFPVAQSQVFLAHAAVCPLPRRVSIAMAKCATRGARGDQEEAVPADFLSRTRILAARLLAAEPEEVALVGPTSLALSFIANGLSFAPGDNVLVYFDDYPSNVYPWMTLGRRGVEVRFLQTRELGRIEPEDVIGQVDGRTRLVALASCHFISGWRLDASALGSALHERNIRFSLDAIQTLGAFPTTVEHVDFLAADAHKWLLGPCAAGIFYVRRDLQEQLQPSTYGWHSIDCPNFVAQENLAFRRDARRYEAGTANLAGLAGLQAALELSEEIGIEAIAAELLRKRAWLVPELEAKGYLVLHGAAPPPRASGIISFYRPDTDMAGLQQTLHEARVTASLRADRAGRQYLRVSPHFYNTDSELEQLLELL